MSGRGAYMAPALAALIALGSGSAAAQPVRVEVEELVIPPAEPSVDDGNVDGDPGGDPATEPEHPLADEGDATDGTLALADAGAEGPAMSAPEPESIVVACGLPSPAPTWRSSVGFSLGNASIATLAAAETPAASAWTAGLTYGRQFGRLGVFADYQFGLVNTDGAADNRDDGLLHRIAVSARYDALRLGPRDIRPIRLFVAAGLGNHWFVARGSGLGFSRRDATVGAGLSMVGPTRGGDVRAWMFGVRVDALLSSAPPQGALACRGTCPLGERNGLDVGMLISWFVAWGR